MEYTLALIQPDAVRGGKASEIQQLAEMAGFCTIARQQLQVRAGAPAAAAAAARLHPLHMYVHAAAQSTRPRAVSDAAAPCGGVF